MGPLETSACPSLLRVGRLVMSGANLFSAHSLIRHRFPFAHKEFDLFLFVEMFTLLKVYKYHYKCIV